ncbi:Transcription factor hamlet [Porphyridium purpureum]|uniref:Transcription factor hamlet n=1 Tax=Porphyridium purpureum TaxID=35688 RepID=A0A5J4YQC5_PORPP|nr:Transcription factor hamlet [Porphyridium purpureum]|eukprot:POR9028..scf236_6
MVIEGAPTSYRSVLKVLLHDDEVSAWLVKWLQPHVDSVAGDDGLNLRASGLLSTDAQDGTSITETGSKDHSSDIEICEGYDDYVSPQELSCLPYLPSQDEMDQAVIWDTDIERVSRTTCATVIPTLYHSSQSRFVHGVNMCNVCITPLPEGVTAFPGLRLTAFRTRYGYAYIAVSGCTNGTILIYLVRMWDNYKWKIETFHTTRVDFDAPLLSYTLIERPGLCTGSCDTGSCKCWRLLSSCRTDDELSRSLDWKEFGPFLENWLRAGFLENPMTHCQAYLGNGQLAFKVSVPTVRLQVATGAVYPRMSALKFLFFDRLTTASSVRHRVQIKSPNCLHSGCEATTGDQNLSIAHNESGLIDGCRSEQSAGSQSRHVEASATHRPQCQNCGKVFGRSSELHRHIRTIHDRVNMPACEECGRIFSQISNLHAHIRVVHEKRRDHECLICNRSFAVVSNWKRHMRQTHGLKDSISKTS